MDYLTQTTDCDEMNKNNGFLEETQKTHLKI